VLVDTGMTELHPLDDDVFGGALPEIDTAATGPRAGRVPSSEFGSPAQRAAQGKSARARVSRSSHGR
jgi:hypothetical protein